jgi:hypothetical protein
MMRTPGRFMLLGQVALAITAAMGLDELRRRMRPALGRILVVSAVALILLETWVGPYPAQPLLAPLPFYQQIAQDQERYGVLDLPIRPEREIEYPTWHIYFSSFYQVDQITHGKGIATGYVSRFYPVHPLFAHFISDNFQTVSPIQKDMAVDGVPSSRYDNLRYYLAKNNYRYVVVHKPSEQHPVYKPGAWGERVAQRLIADVFGDQSPLVDDEFSTVYAVGQAPDASTLKPSIALLEPAAYQGYGEFRRVESPAQLLVHSPRAVLTHLDITLQEIDGGLEYAALTLESGNGNVVTTAPIAPQESLRIPLALVPGSQVITITVAPADGLGEKRGFTIKGIDMATAADEEISIPVTGRAPDEMQAAYGGGWYGQEGTEDSADTWRWAASPATVWIYADEPQSVTLSGVPIALHDATSPDGKGTTGSLALTLNGKPMEEAMPVIVGERFAAPLALPAGWSQLALNLAAGNFRPIDIEPSTGDSRVLSFALQNLRLEP